jgi:5S rRNA maturation endonuclease (ribonuclease M5)
LIQYLLNRGISKYENESSLKEIQYSIKDKIYFAIGFENDSCGFELRSKYAKICLGKKDITHIKNDSKTLLISEGFFDYLSLKQLEKQNEKSDYLILNSVALINKNLNLLNEYNDIKLYLDNDEAGNKATNYILENFPNASDYRINYKEFKDLNEWLVRKQ